MALLTADVSGTAANTNGAAPAIPNKDPVFVENNLLNTVYAWVDTTGGAWGGAQIQLYISPQIKGMPWSTVWFPVGEPITENGYFSFQHRWGQIKAEVVNATSATAGLNCVLFTGM